MNWEQMKKNAGCRVQLVPIAIRLNHNGRELPQIDDDWIIDQVMPDGVRISNTRTGHFTTLGKDHIHHFTSNPDRSRTGVQHGFLTLNVQIFLSGNKLEVRPNARPGEEVRPPSAQIFEKWVDIKYPSDSGLQQKLEAEGYSLRWCGDPRLSQSVDLEGWEVVVEPDVRGVLSTYHLRDSPFNQTLIKKRNG
jgi:hypothetical protein